MAARDRFGGFGEPATTPLQRYIMNAVSPENYEPNLALNLEIADLINAKKGNAPREAAVAIVSYINHRNPNVSLLALALLDICVKNCGYPFHLQISTKEFLNELVRRFPERPPLHPTRTQMRILELIEEWRATICQTSRYKEDLGFIRDMHRLLHFKGYQFPENLRSPEEMEEEEKAAQSAKLQELIRRGGPQDLQEANRLMKVMAGYDTRNKTDYRAKAAEEVGKIQQKAKLLEEMLQGYKPGDQIKEGDVYEELANALASAQPKIQKMCEEESEDTEAVAKLFEINDSIHRTIERYRLIKKGDIEAANKIPKGTLGTSGAGVSKGPDNELSLIDLGGPDEPAPGAADGSSAAAPSAPAPKGNALEDDLLGLSLGGDSYGQGGGISLGTSNGLSVLSSPPKPQTSIPSIFTQPSAPPQPSASKPNYDPFASNPIFNIHARNRQPTPAPILTKIHRSIRRPYILNTPHSLPFQFQQSLKPAPSPSAALFDFSDDTSTPALTSKPPPPATATAPADDDWTFTSALPDSPNSITVTNSAIKTVFSVSRQSDDAILISSRISNNTAQPISELTFQVAVTKGFNLRLEPQSGRSLAPHQSNGITQTIRLLGVERGKGGAVKMRWKASYVVGTERREEMGEVASLGVA
ncbi:ARF-binding protein [Coniosporium tulheliwenetii]|uniref:ARF-binding protein n=1 Tax=Coniosporium tulheliwenetii TaxID=3383036 RepID=A0ACC2ZI09_9PEZI|nr:ARF-binding protein [Cladosporium sp. JES 115]